LKKDSKKRFQINELETDWGGFLVDADAVAALRFFRPRHKSDGAR
jgi:hypothetical protein